MCVCVCVFHCVAITRIMAAPRTERCIMAYSTLYQLVNRHHHSDTFITTSQTWVPDFWRIFKKHLMDSYHSTLYQLHNDYRRTYNGYRWTYNGYKWTYNDYKWTYNDYNWTYKDYKWTYNDYKWTTVSVDSALCSCAGNVTGVHILWTCFYRAAGVMHILWTWLYRAAGVPKGSSVACVRR